ncbi:1,4-dihydroxy-2-naphthoate octaprenyltransferase [Sphingobium fontiphilum]|uniref:1,4-dihydroxy-2-naphthoate octaprenyltransferase n=1 Tax=Sphingobium fontiphilum TaxID=944425 RepID=A0A7W6DK89_9SPHN|nr:DUF6326 family protein [Sphingobium fontiphilum]MBB3982901.1 1,4-dihydroxy-2-naphthoate octaprenyltransferase [Sphingobium fontiphilum]
MSQVEPVGVEPFHAPAPLRLSALWASTMFCYVYGDFFGMFRPGRVMAMNEGIIGPLGPATPTILVAVSVMMAIPSVMIFLALVLPTAINRWLNILLGCLYTAIMLLTMSGGAPPFYLTLGVIEVALTIGIVVTAWRWPSRASLHVFG